MSEENPDYAGPEGSKLRAEAQQYAEERGKLLSASKEAFEGGDKARAKELSEQGKAAGRNMEDANKRAAAVIIKHRNDGKGPHYLDLHGLYLEEAMDAFHTKMNQLQKAAEKEDIVFEVIPGAGNHSKNKAIIKPKVIEELTKMKVRFEEKNAGSINVFLGKGANELKAPEPVTKKHPNEAAAMKDIDASGAKEDEETAAASPKSFGCCIVM